MLNDRKTVISRTSRSINRPIALTLTVLGLAAALTVATPSKSAKADYAFPNETTANVAMQYLGQDGGNIFNHQAAGAPWSQNGECLPFAEAAVWVASGKTIPFRGRNGEGDYYLEYIQLGAREISLTQAAKGDLIQLNNPNDPNHYYHGMHTAIVLDGRTVVDSNFVGFHIVGTHPLADVTNQARQFRLALHVWRFGQVSASMAYQNGLFTAFARGSNGRIYSTSQQVGGVWTGWVDLGRGAALASDPVAAINAYGNIEAFYIGTDGNMYSDGQQVGGTWTGWVNLGGHSLVGSPAALAYQNGLFTAFARGSNGRIYSTSQQVGGVWTGWVDLGGSF